MANETKHRPGPWRLVKDKKFPRLAKIIDADGDEIEETVAALSDAREMATCRLIAAAPELFDALSDLFRAIEGEPAQLYRADAEFHGACSAALRKAFVALTKAGANANK